MLTLEGISFKKAQRIIKKKLDATKVNQINKWFFYLKDSGFEKYNKALIFNCDEIMVDNKGVHTKAFCKARTRPIIAEEPLYLPHITLLLCICADWTFLKPMLIWNLLNIPNDLMEYKNYFIWKYQESGWMTKELFSDWIDYFIECVNNKRKELCLNDERAVLVADGHLSRKNSQIIKKLNDNHIDLLILPPNTSHVLQPLDLRVNGVLKQKLKSLLREVKSTSLSIIKSRRAFFISDLITAMTSALALDFVEGSFAFSGLWPFDTSIALNSRFITKDDDEEDNKYEPKKRKRGPNTFWGFVTPDMAEPKVTLPPKKPRIFKHNNNTLENIDPQQPALHHPQNIEQPSPPPIPNANLSTPNLQRNQASVFTQKVDSKMQSGHLVLPSKTPGGKPLVIPRFNLLPPH